MPNGLYMIFATAVLMITGCASSGLAQPSINESALPASRGYHAEPLRFERWSYLYSDDEAHHLTYRWHVGAQTYSKEILVSPSGCSLVGVREVPKEQKKAVAVRPRVRDGVITQFVRRDTPNNLWVTTTGRHQVSPIMIDRIDDALESSGERASR